MSRYFTQRFAALVPYVPGEQPRDQQYVKLNTNESPFPPSASVELAVEAESRKLQLYSDPECTDLRAKMAEVFGVQPQQVLMTNGSDELLNLAFMAFADEEHPLAFADITYGFYPVIADLNHIPYTEIPLREDFRLDPEDYLGIGKTIVITNPNAPTGLSLPLTAVEKILQCNPDNIVIVDEAYVDFGAESAVRLVDKYENLLVAGTFSKSRSLAGARLGFGIGSAQLIADLNTIKYAMNPYTVNRMTAAAGIAALADNEYYMANCRTIMATRAWTLAQLESLGFAVLPSQANFVFAKSDRIGGAALYQALKTHGVLVRHFDKARIRDYNRITIGTMAQMQILIAAIRNILEEAAL